MRETIQRGPRALHTKYLQPIPAGMTRVRWTTGAVCNPPPPPTAHHDTARTSAQKKRKKKKEKKSLEDKPGIRSAPSVLLGGARTRRPAPYPPYLNLGVLSPPPPSLLRFLLLLAVWLLARPSASTTFRSALLSPAREDIIRSARVHNTSDRRRTRPSSYTVTAASITPSIPITQLHIRSSPARARSTPPPAVSPPRPPRQAQCSRPRRAAPRPR